MMVAFDPPRMGPISESGVGRLPVGASVAVLQPRSWPGDAWVLRPAILRRHSAAADLNFAPTVVGWRNERMRFGGTAGLMGIEFPERVGSAIRCLLELGVKRDYPPRLAKPIRLCNTSAFI